MIKLIYGNRGSGKSIRMIDMANDSVKTCEGDVVYVGFDSSFVLNLNHEIRYINTEEYKISTKDMMYGFICGILAEDYDIKEIYVDNFLKIAHVKQLEEALDLFNSVKKLSEKYDFTLYITISGEDPIPKELVEYQI